MEKIWKKILGYEGLYQISNVGEVKRNGKILCQNIDNRGRKSVLLSKNNLSTRFRIHRLVAEAFVKKTGKNNFVCHKDGDNQNNRASNLYWGNAKTNSHDAVKHGTNFGFIIKGEKVWCSKLLERDVLEIRRREELGEMKKDLANKFGVSKPVISNIVNRRIWKHI